MGDGGDGGQKLTGARAGDLKVQPTPGSEPLYGGLPMPKGEIPPAVPATPIPYGGLPAPQGEIPPAVPLNVPPRFYVDGNGQVQANNPLDARRLYNARYPGDVPTTLVPAAPRQEIPRYMPIPAAPGYEDPRHVPAPTARRNEEPQYVPIPALPGYGPHPNPISNLEPASPPQQPIFTPTQWHGNNSTSEQVSEKAQALSNNAFDIGQLAYDGLALWRRGHGAGPRFERGLGPLAGALAAEQLIDRTCGLHDNDVQVFRLGTDLVAPFIAASNWPIFGTWRRKLAILVLSHVAGRLVDKYEGPAMKEWSRPPDH